MSKVSKTVTAVLEFTAEVYPVTKLKVVGKPRQVAVDQNKKIQSLKMDSDRSVYAQSESRKPFVLSKAR
jgi:hypothetical protein